MRQIIIAGSLLIVLMLMLGCLGTSPTTPPGNGGTGGQVKQPSSLGEFKLVQATGADDIQAALEASAYSGGNWGLFNLGSRSAGAVSEAGGPGSIDIAADYEAPQAPPSPTDYSTTNVQVVGVDELDIVKVDSETGNRMYVLNGDALNFLNAYPPEDMERYADVETEWGNGIYEFDDVVIAISYERLEAFYKEDGTEAWHVNLNSSYVDSRMVDGVIYLVLQEYPRHPYKPMPLERCAGGKCTPLVIDYPSIYIPQDMSAEVFYDVISLNAKTGELMDAKAFMGPYSSTLYMSRSNIYVGMHEQKSETTVMFDFILEDGRGILPAEVQKRVEYLDTLDISDDSKTLEFMLALQKWMAVAEPEESANLFNDLQNGLDDYISKYPEKLEYTGIAKIGYDGLGGLSEPKTGIVPGRLLNQFAMDEYNGALRLAVTYGRWSEAENGVIVLDSDMAEAGRVTGLAEGERIYAVRFIGRYGYVVTFRETDPLFIIDLANPAKPEVKGQLKVPGFSTYLHPIGTDQLLGIGKESGKVKLSLFDISNPNNPAELDTFIMDAYWSEALYNHHAFLYYQAKDLVILPIGGKDYVFRVKDGQISLRKILKENAVRNVYMDQYLYIITSDEVIAYSLSNYEEIERVDLKGNYGRYYYDDVWTEESVPATAPEPRPN